MSIVVNRKDDDAARVLALAAQLDAEREAAQAALLTVDTWMLHGCADAADRRRLYASWQFANVVSQPRSLGLANEALYYAEAAGENPPQIIDADGEFLSNAEACSTSLGYARECSPPISRAGWHRGRSPLLLPPSASASADPLLGNFVELSELTLLAA